MILKVARLGHPVLRLKAARLDPSEIGTAAVQRLIQDMIQTMHEYDGVGIAAPQVHVSLQIAVFGAAKNPRYPKAPRIPLTVMINPKVRPVSKRTQLDWEGCLSVDGLRGSVPRWNSVEVEAYNAQGKQVRFRAAGFTARVIQHEWDHLNGRVYLDRMKDMSTLTHLNEFSRYWASA